jgi:hypothetical protein
MKFTLKQLNTFLEKAALATYAGRGDMILFQGFPVLKN